MPEIFHGIAINNYERSGSGIDGADAADCNSGANDLHAGNFYAQVVIDG